MRRWLFFILISLAVNSAFTQGNIVWPQSDSEIITNANATIAIQESNFSNITLEGYDNIPANAYVGVFYTDGFDYGCGGFTQWPDNGENFVIAAFGDDPFTSVVDGFISGQPYTWFLRINNSDNPLDGWTDYIGQNLVMDASDAFQENWFADAFSNIISVDFVLYAEWTNCMDLSACNYNQAATVSVNDDCVYPVNQFVDCDGNCYDEDNDGICNFDEEGGCMNPNAVNYNPNATTPFILDQTTNLETAIQYTCYVVGCQDENALNYDPDANATGPCEYPIYQLDWSFTPTDPIQSSILAIININGLPDYDFSINEAFCNDVTVGAFYNNIPYSEFNNGYVDSEFLGYSNGSDWNCLPSQPYPYLALFVDDNTTSAKDGFNPGEPLLFVVEVGGIEYLATPSFSPMSDITSSEFQVSALYVVVELNIVEPVQFGCTDPDYLEYWNYDEITASISPLLDTPKSR